MRQKTMRHMLALLAAGCVTATSLVAALTLARLFTDSSFLPKVLALAAIAHLLAVACRWWRIPLLVSAVISVVVLVLVGNVTFYPDQRFYVLPTAETFNALLVDLRAAEVVFTESVVPVEPLQGFVVVAAVFVWMAAFVADTAAFRRRLAVETFIPATILFVFAALMGTDRNQIVYGVAFTAAVIASLLSLRALNQTDHTLWSTAKANRGVATALRGGAIFGVLALAVAGLVVSQFSPAVSQPLLNVKDLTKSQPTRNIISPLVNVSASLVNQSDEEIFSVKVAENERDYWRLMALTSFDGSQWQRTSSFVEIGNSEVSSTANIANRRTLTQTFTKAARNSSDIYLPVANELSRVIDSGGLELEYEVETGALVYHVDSATQAAGGFTYTVESLVPDYDPAQLPARTAENVSEEFLNEYTHLPPVCGPDETALVDDCWPQRINDLARQVTASASNDFQRARLLQDFFRDPQNFTYDLDVAHQHDVSTAEQFLFNVRRGYCEQFASVFAAMVRSLGIPARVAVGYTWGTWNPDRQEYVVRGHHAHAWPEVYFAGVGWVAFEPTPGRSRAYDADITGLNFAAQYPSNETGERSEFGALPTPANPANNFAPTIPAPNPTAATSPTNPSNIEVNAPSTTTRVFEIARVVALVAVVLVAVALITPTSKAIQHRRHKRRAADSPLLLAELAWDDASRALELLGLSPQPHHTPMESARLMSHTRTDLGALNELAANVTALRYAGSLSADVSAAQHQTQLAHNASKAASQIIGHCRKISGMRRVALSALDPRPYFRSSGRWKR